MKGYDGMAYLCFVGFLLVMLLLLIVPGDALLCVGRHNDLRDLVVAGICMITIGEALVIVVTVLVSLNKTDRSWSVIAISAAIVAIGLGPGLGCGLASWRLRRRVRKYLAHLRRSW